VSFKPFDFPKPAFDSYSCSILLTSIYVFFMIKFLTFLSSSFPLTQLFIQGTPLFVFYLVPIFYDFIIE